MMTEAEVTWHKGLKFTGSSDSGFEVELGHENDGFRPMELFAVALVGCTAMDVVSILNKKQQKITDFRVKVHADRASGHPKVFTHARIEYKITGHAVDEAAVVRAIELSATRYCPAQAMFDKVIPIELVYSIYEDMGEGEPKLVRSGSYTRDLEPANE
jgi:putative redox protein